MLKAVAAVKAVATSKSAVSAEARGRGRGIAAIARSRTLASKDLGAGGENSNVPERRSKSNESNVPERRSKSNESVPEDDGRAGYAGGGYDKSIAAKPSSKAASVQALARAKAAVKSAGRGQAIIANVDQRSSPVPELPSSPVPKSPSSPVPKRSSSKDAPERTDVMKAAAKKSPSSPVPKIPSSLVPKRSSSKESSSPVPKRSSSKESSSPVPKRSSSKESSGPVPKKVSSSPATIQRSKSSPITEPKPKSESQDTDALTKPKLKIPVKSKTVEFGSRPSSARPHNSSETGSRPSSARSVRSSKPTKGAGKASRQEQLPEVLCYEVPEPKQLQEAERLHKARLPVPRDLQMALWQRGCANMRELSRAGDCLGMAFEDLCVCRLEASDTIAAADAAMSARDAEIDIVASLEAQRNRLAEKICVEQQCCTETSEYCSQLELELESTTAELRSQAIALDEHVTKLGEHCNLERIRANEHLQQIQAELADLRAEWECETQRSAVFSRTVRRCAKEYAAGARSAGGWLSSSSGWLGLVSFRSWAEAVARRHRSDNLNLLQTCASRHASHVARVRGARMTLLCTRLQQRVEVENSKLVSMKEETELRNDYAEQCENLSD